RGRAPGSPYANPCPAQAPVRSYKTAFIQTEITVNRHGWFDPQGRIIVLEDDIKDVIDANRRTRLPEPLFFRANSGDCINYKSSNLVPSALNADDFQLYTPTDTIGQHIHLVKFDVTSSDGSANGWNYEDATFSPDEVRERIVAINRSEPGRNLKPQVHPLFRPGGNIDRTNFQALWTKGQCPERMARESDHAYLQRLSRDHPFCGAQRTTQRWWADPILVRGGAQAGKDNTLRTVFTHDHMGPSSHQQHGLYAALVIEPANSVWQANAADQAGGAAAVQARCVSPGLRGIAVAQNVALNPKDVSTRDVDDAVYAAFALRAAAQVTAQAKALAQDCLNVALLGGSDLSLPRVALGAPGGEQLQPVGPRPVLHNRTDGGPTSPRATIVSPTCIGEPDSSPLLTGSVRACGEGREANQTRREFALAFADFAGVYNTALEPINPETPRDVSMRRFGDRQVATRGARPIAISSEDPGTQLINYRHEPLALRIADLSLNKMLGGFDFSQSLRRIDGSACKAGDIDCLGDMANGFSSFVHSRRDRALATQPYVSWLAAQSSNTAVPALIDTVSPRWRELVPQAQRAAWKRRVSGVLGSVESWRQDFNCALYAPAQWLATGSDSGFDSFCAQHYRRAAKPPVRVQEPWRVFGDPATPILATREGDPVQIRLIQGAQEAQHVFTMNGVKWHRLPDSLHSGYVNAQPIGISEHFEFDVRVPSFDMPQGDYLYFGSSVDQLWDGMWGVMRAYKSDGPAPGNPVQLATGQSLVQRPSDWLPGVPGARPTQSAEGAGGVAAVCQQTESSNTPVSVRSFDVSAVRACDLTKSCGQPGNRGLTYSQRFGITDPMAMVYVLSREASCEKRAGELFNADGCFPVNATMPALSNLSVLDRLQSEFAAGRPLEPLVLRASAGQCITVKLRNHLPLQVPVMARDKPVQEKDAYYNFLPMITDGFNLNQFRMSNAVGISAPRVAQNPVSSDGSNTGLNSAALAKDKSQIANPGGPSPSPSPFPSAATPQAKAVHKQGTLVAPCSAADARNPMSDCSFNYVWSASDLQTV
ncbi:MAG: hypothetical protein ABIQ60_03705, partial [Burkholderiaceae bacterium]